MHRDDVIEALRSAGIAPSAQRLAVAEHVLVTHEHPSADQVFATVKRAFPMLSRATVYNTLNLFVERGLLRQLVLAEGRVVFDPNVEKHHHFIDEATGEILDIAWDALAVDGVEDLRGVEIHAYEVVVRGRLKRRKPADKH